MGSPSAKVVIDFGGEQEEGDESEIFWEKLSIQRL